MAHHRPPVRHSMLDGIDLKKPLHKGYVYKQSHLHLAFNKRFCVLYPRVLAYYEREEDFRKDAARQTLEHRHKAVILDKLWLSKPENKPKGAKYCFVLNVPDKRNERHEYLMVTHTRAERKEWMEKLQALNPSLLAPDATIVSPDTPNPPRREIRSESIPDARLHLPPNGGAALLSPPDAGGPRRGSCIDLNELDLRDGSSDTED